MNTAYSYISNLILINDKEKSNLKKIKEVHRKLEDDKERESIEAKQKTYLHSPVRSLQPNKRATNTSIQKARRVFIETGDTVSVADEHEPI